MVIRQQEKANIYQLGAVSFNIMQELKKEAPDFNGIDSKIRKEFGYQEYLDSIRDLPYEVEDPESSDEEDEVSEHD